jgi:hypothetical protein
MALMIEIAELLKSFHFLQDEMEQHEFFSSLMVEI